MLKIEKTVFISYRRKGDNYFAQAIFENLTRHGYDVFLDYESINAGDFEQFIFQSIESRAHFLLILTPSTLERCKEPRDMVRREIEHALKHQRNIIPLTFEGFDFKDVQSYLPEHLHILSNYNGMRVPAGFFHEAMKRLRERFLNIPIEAVLHPVSSRVDQYEEKQQAKARSAPPVTGKQLTAEEYFERGLKHLELDNLDFAIADFTEAIRIIPEFASAYNNRGVAHGKNDEFDAAIRDFNTAIQLNPNYADAYSNRGYACNQKGNYDTAILDLTTAIQIDPKHATAYNNRGFAYVNKDKYDAAIYDYTAAIQLNPDYADGYNDRGNTYLYKGEYDAAIHDYDNAIQLNPNYAEAFNNRGLAHDHKGDYDAAIRDFEQCLRINPNAQKARINLENTRRKKHDQK